MNAALKENFMGVEDVTPTIFLRELLSIAPGDAVAWWTAFDADPSQATDKDWKGQAYQPEHELPAIENRAAFYSIASFEPKAKSRSSKIRHAGTALLLDDVGTKADPSAVRTTLGEPSYRIETSPGNEQWGYLPTVALKPDELDKLHGKLKALKACDRSGVNSVRYGRLPAGKNRKSSSPDFAVTLVEWEPTRRYSLAYLRDRLGLEVEDSSGKRILRYTPADVVHEGRPKAGAPSLVAGETLGRDVELTSFAGTLVDKVDPEKLLELMFDHNAARTSTRLSDAEVRKLWKSVARYKLPADDDVDPEFAGVDPRIVEELRALRPNELVLPNDFVPYPVAARSVFTRLAAKRQMYVRSRQIVEVARTRLKDGGVDLSLALLGADAFRSRIEGGGHQVKHAVKHGDGLVLKARRCSKDVADVLMQTEEAWQLLPPIELITRNSVLIEIDGELRVLEPGYHNVAGGIMVGGLGVELSVPLDTATKDLAALLDEFQFLTPADKSRAMANFIGPCLRMSRLLHGHALINAVEADKSQTGKGYLLAVQRAPYGEPTELIAKRDGGVGSFDESLGHALLRGVPFITFDNLRGRLTSEYLESALTAHGLVNVRVPHRGEVGIDSSRTTFHLTSNGFETTNDLGNRALITRLVKQPVGYKFRQFAEGGLLQHVQAQQSHYLGCIFAVVRAWHVAGKPQLVTNHSFREWVGALDWIVQKLFNMSPLLDGHEKAVEQVSTPGLSWLRQLALIVEREGRLGMDLRAGELGTMSVNANLPLPGAQPDADDDARQKQVGILMRQCFDARDQDKDRATTTIDRFVVTRFKARVPGAHVTKWYVFNATGSADDQAGGM